MMSNIYITFKVKIIVLFLFIIFTTQQALSQASFQIINPTGGTNTALSDGLKIAVAPDGSLSVFRGDYAQYCCNVAYPPNINSVANNYFNNRGVKLKFRFSQGTTYNSSERTMVSCATTTVQVSGNTSTTSISGYVISPISNKRFYVTINLSYTRPNEYFTVDYYVRAPYDLPSAETVHMYLDHDAYILGSDGSRAYLVKSGTADATFVGDFRNSNDTNSTCSGGKGSVTNYPAHHGFKSTGFRSYYTGPYSPRNNIKGENKLYDIYDTGMGCKDDGIAVEFITGPLAAGKIGARRVLHCYGRTAGQFNSIAVTNPTPPTGTSSPVSVDFTASNFYELEGSNTPHLATAAKIRVAGGVLASDQVCNFTIYGGNATLGTHYTYVQGFTIPAGNYTTPKELTLNNITLIGNDNCDGANRTFNIRIETELCNDLIQPGGTQSTATFEIVDDDAPEVNQPQSKTYCKGVSVPANTFVFSGSTVPNTTYTWTNNNTAIGLASSGTGNIPVFTTNNTTANPITATITVTPKQGSCSGNSKTFTITVNPTATVNAITNKTECNNATVTTTTFTSPTTGATFTWANNNTAIGLAASGSGNLPSFTAKNNTAAPITATITVTPTYAGCTGTARTFTITVNPTATVNAITNKTECNNATVAATSFSSPTTGATFAWTNNNTAIGLAASGSGNLPSFTAKNNTTAPITATITVTPSYGGCTGTARTFTITVNPTATVNTIANKIECNNATVAATSFSSPTTGAIFAWTNNNTAIGLAASGSGNLPSFTAKNNTTAPITATITVTPSYGGCTGTARTFTITVNPTATVNTIANKIECNNATVGVTAFSSPTTGATFAWTNNNTAIGLAASGSGNLPSFTATNTTANPISATITVTPSYGGCTGTARTFTITVNPTATVNAISNIEICNNSVVPVTNFGSPTTGATFTWANNNTAIGLAASGSGNLPSFTATNTTANPISATITVTPTYAGCTGTPRTFTIKVYAPVVPGTITGNPFVCTGMIPLPLTGTASSGGSTQANLKYQWQSKVGSGGTWTNITGATGQNYTPTAALTGDTYFRRVTTDNYCNTFTHNSNEFLIKVVAAATTLYWNKNATDNNWNNPANWLNTPSGTSLGMVPVACTDVHIIGTSTTKYPSLDDNTPTNVFGNPVCKNITFHYGAELAFQHKLQYEKAYVQYNWGHYNTASPTPTSPLINIDNGGQMKQRDKWYALAAPLKSMASGDFSFAGYPMTWQGGFAVSHPVTGATGNIAVGDFISKQFAKNDVNLSTTNNAIAIKVSAFKNSIGYNDHCNLEGLKGIIELPYFEDPAKDALFAAHDYDKFTGESRFYYFNPTTLQIIHNPVGRMKRGDEAYRFIYEKKESGVWKTPTITVGSSSVAGYSMTITKSGSSQEVMIGNPFMASINAQRFFNANSTKIAAGSKYRIYSSTTSSWVTKEYVAGNNIAPLQAFIVTLANGSVNELLFPLEGTGALTGIGFRGQILMQPIGRSLYLKTSIGNTVSEYAVLDTESEKKLNLKQMIHPDGHATPEVFFISPDGDGFNLIQYFEDGIDEIGIGVKCSDTNNSISLIFDNVSEFLTGSYLRPVLVDKHLGTQQDLTLNNTYQFKQRSMGAEKQYIDSERFALRLISEDSVIEESKTDDITITYDKKTNELKVVSAQVLTKVEVYDMYSRLVHFGNKVNSTLYTNNLLLPQGVYVVKVQTEKGKTRVEKIAVL